MSSSRARAPSAVSSAPRRDRTNVRVRAPSAIRSAITRAASAPAERRTGAPFSPMRSVAQRRLPQRHRPGAVRRAVLGDLLDGLADQLRRRWRRVARWWRWRRSPSASEPGRRVARAQPQQPAQHHRHVRAENASVVMAFVDDDVVADRAGRPPSGRGCAAATGGSCPGWRTSTGSVPARTAAPRRGCRRRRRSARRRASRGHRRGQRVRGAQLVVAERLGRRQVQRPGPRIGCQRREDRQLVGQRFARRGAGADHDVTAVVGEVGGRDLMRPRRVDTALGEAPHHIWVGPVRPRRVGGRAAAADRRRGAADVRPRRCRRARRRAARGRNPTPHLPT